MRGAGGSLSGGRRRGSSDGNHDSPIHTLKSVGEAMKLEFGNAEHIAMRDEYAAKTEFRELWDEHAAKARLARCYADPLGEECESIGQGLGDCWIESQEIGYSPRIFCEFRETYIAVDSYVEALEILKIAVQSEGITT